jgi:hypothetical protein
MFQWLINVLRAFVAALILPIKIPGVQADEGVGAAWRAACFPWMMSVVREGCSLQTGLIFSPWEKKALPGSHTGRNL